LGSTGGAGVPALADEVSVRVVRVVVGLALTPAVLPAQARVATEHVIVELRALAPVVRPGEGFDLELRLETAPGWHFYAPDPGDGGVPARIEWSLPAGIEIRSLEWPDPERLEEPPFVLHVYRGDVVVRARLEAGGGVADSAVISARITGAVCREVCVVQEADVSLVLPVVAATFRAHDLRNAVCRNARRAYPEEECPLRSCVRGSRTPWTGSGSSRPSSRSLLWGSSC
jgi:DsbC/DsbD-like thiol-disulfide interchange protein